MERVRVVIVGASHAGHQAILELLSRYNDYVEIVVIEASETLSFMSGGVGLYLQNIIDDPKIISNFTEADFANYPNVKLFVRHQAKKINPKDRTISIVNLNTNEDITLKYDRIILAIGVQTAPIDVFGNDLANIFVMRGYENTVALKKELNKPENKDVVVVGSGHTGIETAEILRKINKNVTVIDVLHQPLESHIDGEMSELVKSELLRNGVEVMMNTDIIRFEGEKKVEKVITTHGEIKADIVIQASGITPLTNWLKDTLDLDYRNWIVTNEYLETSIPGIYAVGDATLTYSIPAKKKMNIGLGSTARREARYVAQHLFEKIPTAPFRGVTGTSVFHIFDYTFATAGINTHTAEQIGILVKSSYFEDNMLVEFLPKDRDNPKIHTKLFFNPISHRIIGGAIMAKHDISDQGNVISLAIDRGMTLEELSDADFFFQNEYNRQWNIWNLAAQYALGEKTNI